MGVTRKSELEIPRREVPDLPVSKEDRSHLDGSVRTARSEPLVADVHSHTTHPSQVTCNDAGHLPRGMPLGDGHSLVTRT